LYVRRCMFLQKKCVSCYPVLWNTLPEDVPVYVYMTEIPLLAVKSLFVRCYVIAVVESIVSSALYCFK